MTIEVRITHLNPTLNPPRSLLVDVCSAHEDGAPLQVYATHEVKPGESHVVCVYADQSVIVREAPAP